MKKAAYLWSKKEYTSWKKRSVQFSQLEEEVKLLWAALSTTNFELHVLEDNAEMETLKFKLPLSKLKNRRMKLTIKSLMGHQFEIGAQLSADTVSSHLYNSLRIGSRVMAVKKNIVDS